MLPVSAPPSTNQVPPTGDQRAELQALRAQIEELRQEINGRLDALSAVVDRLLPSAGDPATAASPAAPQPEHAGAQQPVSPPITRRLPPSRTLRPGDMVYVPQLGGSYTVVEAAPGDATFKVQAGTIRVEVRRDEVWALDDAATAETAERGKGQEPTISSRWPEVKAAIPEIDLHGYSEDDALITLELFLHHAFAQRTPRVRIIHGKGNGILRAAVRRELARNPLVRAVDSGPHFRGDDGVTLADLDL